MAPGYSDSGSEEERHDRFKSERNPGSAPVFRKNVPSSLTGYSSRARSPLRPNICKSSRHKSRYSEERRYSPHRREKSPVVRRSRDRSSPKENNGRISSSEHKHSRHKHRKSHSKFRNERYEDDLRRKNDEKELRFYDRKRNDEHESRNSDRISEESSDRLSDQNIDDLENKKVVNENKSSKKHKRSRERSESHSGKRKKKEKKHKRKHDKKRSKDEGTPQVVLPSANRSEHQDAKNSVDLTSDLSSSIEEQSDSDNTESSDVQENNPTHTNSTTVVESINEVSDIKARNSEHEEGELSGSESEQLFGPALPPRKKTEKSYGPQMLPGMDRNGPTLSPPFPRERISEEDEAGDVIGPLPVGHESAAQSALDARASMLKYQMENKSDNDLINKREAWMLELPDVKSAQLGLGPRKFRAKPAPDMSNRSEWTDTPEDKARKKLLGEEESCDIDSQRLEIIERNKEMELLAKKSEKKSKSLLDIHQKELKKKKKKEEKERGSKPAERVPFSREKDLQTNKFDETQKRSIIKKAQLLNSRFSIGESKYL